MITINDSTQLQTEYFPTILRKLPISPNLQFFLFTIITMERKFKKQRGDWFITCVDQIANEYGVSNRTAKDYLQQLKALKIIQYEKISRVSYYRINWTKIGEYGTQDDLYISENNTMKENVTEVQVEPAVKPDPVVEDVQTIEVEMDDEKDESDIIYDNVIAVVRPSLPRWRAMKTNKMLICKRADEIQTAITGICQTHKYNLSQRKEVMRIINSLAS